jgi:membrane peptidoglycan carboxypeptidase
MPSHQEVLVRKRRLWLWPLILLILIGAAGVIAYELVASPFQAVLLANYGKRLTYDIQSGPSERIRFPANGPYDQRLGYSRLPDFIQRLTTGQSNGGFTLVRQARISSDMARLSDLGIFLPYRERAIAGIHLRDCRGETLLNLPQPRRHYAAFDDIPPAIANTLLYIENRELLDANHPSRNPAVEWDRFAQAVLEKGIQLVQPGRNVPGGSTLATQIEKYRHSPDGLTLHSSDKLLQMASASLRVYLDGPDTRASRRHIVLDYLNTVPLSAAPGHGEVIGLADALDAWFGLDFDQVNQLVRGPKVTPEAASAYKHVLALLISQRRPSYYLINDRAQLEAATHVHLRLLTNAGVITTEIHDLAIKQPLRFRATEKAAPSNGAFVENKAANALRVELARWLGLSRLYDLDRLDLTASTSLHAGAQQQVTHFLRTLSNPNVVRAQGLYGHYLLDADNDLSKIIYSFTLHELTPDGALLRIQADNLNQPFDINQGAKLDMGSSAKLRTLITYLQLVSELHKQYGALSPKALAQVRASPKDPLTGWALEWLKTAPDRSLSLLLQAAMGRTYSANPREGFFTGGGLHYFNNFHREDDHKVMDLWEATRNSVNLPFIRLMRDVVRHLTYRHPSSAAQILEDPNHPNRKDYLEQFADREGKIFLTRFYKKYKGMTRDQALQSLIGHLSAHPKRLAAVYRYLEPNADLAAFTAFMQTRLTQGTAFSADEMALLYDSYGPDKFDLSDRSYIAQVHPLELWLVAWLNHHPEDKLDAVIATSRPQRIEVYRWLFKTGFKNAQDNRIQSLFEVEAFAEVHRRWRAMGYPFNSLVPSYATAIGSSADRPAALAEMMGVILNDGIKLPAADILHLKFAADSPYHTELHRKPPKGERILSAEVAATVRQALLNVVQEGTARRIRGTFTTAEGDLPIGGKTGTGDHRLDIFGPGGKVIESKVMNRVATFAFFMGNRHFGVITAFVPGEAAGNYHFTSGLVVQILKAMAPILRPLVQGPEHAAPSWEELVRAFEADNPQPEAPTPPPVAPPVVVKPVATPVAKPAAKPAEKPAEKPAHTPQTKPAPAVTPETKASAPAPEMPKHAPKPPEKPVEKPSEKPADKPADKPIEKPKPRNPWVSPEYEYLF